ncbi:MAG: hypothetical protein PHI85_10000 [Victivallaceae bacterium]|nr:hypothetical protein [Victivallaceae bacterium]
MSEEKYKIFYSKLDGERRLTRVDVATGEIEYSLDGGRTWLKIQRKNLTWK